MGDEFIMEGATNEALINKIRALAKDDPAMVQWISTALGATVNKAIGKDAKTGATLAHYGTKWNFLDEVLEDVQTTIEEAEADAAAEAVSQAVSELEDFSYGKSVVTNATITNEVLPFTLAEKYGNVKEAGHLGDLIGVGIAVGQDAQDYSESDLTIAIGADVAGEVAGFGITENRKDAYKPGNKVIRK
jgi:hypothetical protein